MSRGHDSKGSDAVTVGSGHTASTVMSSMSKSAKKKQPLSQMNLRVSCGLV